MLKFIIRHFARDENGGIAIMFALMLPVIFGVIGLGVEAGLWFKERRELQTIADAAAVSAAIENAYGATSTELATAATLEATLNGFDATTDTITYVGTPTTVASAYFGDVDYVEVIVTRNLDTILSQVFYTFNPTTTARAIASTSGDTDACVLALSTTASPAINLSGSAVVDMNGCGLVSNSTDVTNSVNVSNGATLSVDCVWSAGGIDGTMTTTECDAPVENALAADDPFDTVDVPTMPASCIGGTAMTGAKMTISTDTVLSEGRYCQGLKITGGNVTLSAGTYIMDSGDFDMSGSGTLTGDGVTIILTSSTDAASNTGAISVTGSGAVDLSAPTTADISGTVTGDYIGILFYQDRNANTIASKNNKFTGGSTTELSGAIYTPSNNIDFSGGNDTNAPGCLMLVGQEVGFTGTADIENECSMYGGNPVLYGASPGLVE